MRRYTVAVDGQLFTVDVAETASDAFDVVVDGRHYAATLTGDRDLPVAIASEPGPRTAEPDAGPDRVAANGADANGASALGSSPTDLATALRPIATVPRPPARATSRRPTTLLTAPMPGGIVEVRVASGAAVKRGDTLLVLEAMKMRNGIRAPRDATVEAVLVEPGAQVASGDPLVRFGPPTA